MIFHKTYNDIILEGATRKDAVWALNGGCPQSWENSPHFFSSSRYFVFPVNFCVYLFEESWFRIVRKSLIFSVLNNMHGCGDLIAMCLVYNNHTLIKDIRYRCASFKVNKFYNYYEIKLGHTSHMMLKCRKWRIAGGFNKTGPWANGRFCLRLVWPYRGKLF